jgi:hypothetical protein
VSLYGTGRREGIVTVLLLVVLVGAVHALGAVQLGKCSVDDVVAAARSGLFPALGGLFAYRLLRAQGRSRYAGFLAATAYALSPWLVAMAIVPREQLAAALAPLALEAAYRCGRPAERRRWLSILGLCLAAPFAAGHTVVGALAVVLAQFQLARAVWLGERGERRRLARAVAVAIALAIVAAGTLLWTDPLARTLGAPSVPPVPSEVLAAHRPATWLSSSTPATAMLGVPEPEYFGADALGYGLDAAALVRLPGPVLLLFALLGILRRQRHVAKLPWLVIAALGAVPTFAIALLPLDNVLLQHWPPVVMLPTAAWWYTLVAIAVLGAAGLDDFLDLPQRRRSALPWLLALAVAVAPLIPAFCSQAPEQEWPLTATFLLLAVLMPTWRRVGILRFKNVLAVATLLALSVPALQVLPTTPVLQYHAVPLAEGRVQLSGYDRVRNPAQSPWRYSGLALAVLVSFVWALSALRRSRKASPPPATAKATIAKKARPPHSS